MTCLVLHESYDHFIKLQRHSMKKIILALCIIATSGCATSAISPDKASPVPSSRVFAFQNSNEHNPVLTVVRDTGMLGSGCFYGLYVNGERAALLNTGERVDLHLKPGEWNIGFKGEGKVCISDDSLSEKEISLSASQHKAVRLFADLGGNLEIKAVTLSK